jgi:hypothetical protein
MKLTVVTGQAAVRSQQPKNPKTLNALGLASLTFVAIGLVPLDALAAWVPVSGVKINPNISGLAYGPYCGNGFTAVEKGTYAVKTFAVYHDQTRYMWQPSCGTEPKLTAYEIACADEDAGCVDIWVLQRVRSGKLQIQMCNTVYGTVDSAIATDGPLDNYFGIEQIIGDGQQKNGLDNGLYVLAAQPAPAYPMYHWDGTTMTWSPALFGGANVTQMARTESNSVTFTFAVAANSQPTMLWQGYPTTTNTLIPLYLSIDNLWSGLPDFSLTPVEDSQGIIRSPGTNELVGPLPNHATMAAFVTDGTPASGFWFVVAVDTAGNVYQDGSTCFPGPSCDPAVQYNMFYH